MNLIPTLLISFITLSVILRYWGFPLLFRRLTQFRVSSFSLLSVRGLEWRKSSRPNAVVPTLRVERAGWTWGGLKGEEVGLVILRLEGVSYRVEKTAKGDPSVGGEDPPRSSVSSASLSQLALTDLRRLLPTKESSSPNFCMS